MGICASDGAIWIKNNIDNEETTLNFKEKVEDYILSYDYDCFVSFLNKNGLKYNLKNHKGSNTIKIIGDKKKNIFSGNIDYEGVSSEHITGKYDKNKIYFVENNYKYFGEYLGNGVIKGTIKYDKYLSIDRGHFYVKGFFMLKLKVNDIEDLVKPPEYGS